MDDVYMLISYGRAADSVVLGVFLCRDNKSAGRNEGDFDDLYFALY